ncbi:hypothetical protein OG921_24435 [Aldersonia sp. NBC_00410]|uniref:hypothetical protein n=1 Tax=Aldersonia sp. NBC_00410 TaxID=2975954 RepID=UPI00224EFF6D|nr:hypothetical protein [Aldersonia sp. NBC_00410]MCX5044838.1 hypothetical protein [Aldersonia sp. NBC_00410]MCX5046325.1 hypothetical protein [Aldersonia sp. NBC_00410]
MSEPSTPELIDSVITAGGWYDLTIEGDERALSITQRRGATLNPPVPLTITPQQQLSDYYCLCANDAPPGRSPWEEWMLLMSVHLEEAV